MHTYIFIGVFPSSRGISCLYKRKVARNFSPHSKGTGQKPFPTWKQVALNLSFKLAHCFDLESINDP